MSWIRKRRLVLVQEAIRALIASWFIPAARVLWARALHGEPDWNPKSQNREVTAMAEWVLEQCRS